MKIQQICAAGIGHCSVWVGNHPSALLVVTGVWGTSLWLAWCAKRYQPSGREGSRAWNFQVAHKAWKMDVERYSNGRHGRFKTQPNNQNIKKKPLDHRCQKCDDHWIKGFEIWRWKRFAPKDSLSMSPAVPPCHAWLIPQADPDQPVEIGSGVPWSITILSKGDWTCVNQTLETGRNGNDGKVMKMNKVFTIPKLLGPEYMQIPLDKAGFGHISSHLSIVPACIRTCNLGTPMI